MLPLDPVFNHNAVQNCTPTCYTNSERGSDLLTRTQCGPSNIPVQGNQNPVQYPAGRFQSWSLAVLKWSMIICFPYWFAALLKLVMIKIMILSVLLCVGFHTFIVSHVAPYFC